MSDKRSGDRFHADLVELLRGRSAHMAVEDAVEGLPPSLRGQRPSEELGGGHSVYELLEHIRRAQEDLLRYTVDPEWISPPWPEGYWPEDAAGDVDDAGWERCLDGFRSDLKELLALAGDPARDLTAPLPHAPEHTPLRELLLAASHNSYHTGQIVMVRKALGAWPTKK